MEHTLTGTDVQMLPRNNAAWTESSIASFLRVTIVGQYENICIYIYIFVNMYVWGSAVGTSKKKKCFRQVVYSPASLSSPALRKTHWKLHCRRLASSIVIHSEVLSVVPPTYLDRFNMIPNHQNVPLASTCFRSINIIVRKLARNMLYIRCSVIKYLR